MMNHLLFLFPVLFAVPIVNTKRDIPTINKKPFPIMVFPENKGNNTGNSNKDKKPASQTIYKIIIYIFSNILDKYSTKSMQRQDNFYMKMITL